jgi:hypothetical protein
MKIEKVIIRMGLPVFGVGWIVWLTAWLTGNPLSRRTTEMMVMSGCCLVFGLPLLVFAVLVVLDAFRERKEFKKHQEPPRKKSNG